MICYLSLGCIDFQSRSTKLINSSSVRSAYFLLASTNIQFFQIPSAHIYWLEIQSEIEHFFAMSATNFSISSWFFKDVRINYFSSSRLRILDCMILKQRASAFSLIYFALLYKCAKHIIYLLCLSMWY